MNLQGVYHKPKSNYCYAYDENTVYIRIRTVKGDISNVKIIYGDKYDWENHEEVFMIPIASDKLYDYFSIEVKVLTKRLAYYFLLKDESEEFFYTEWGFSKTINENELYLHFFQYPYINRVDIHKVPEWVKDAVFYQIFPERFSNGDLSNDPQELEAWGSTPKPRNFFGGDLKGIIDKLDYLMDLGINAIYLTPVFEAPTNHKYDTTDYFKIDPHFGDLDTLKDLVNKCHNNGIRIILDAVFNHSGFFFPPFQDVVEKGAKSKYYNWFHIKQWPIKLEPPSYDTFAFVSHMPKLNTEDPEVRKYLLDIGRYWVKEADIDGWRLDVANEIDHSFWRDFRRAIKDVKEDAYIVGEIWHDSLPWLMGDQFDAIMNYPFMRVCLEYFANGNMDELEFMDSISDIQMRNTKQVNEVMLDLLDSHDTARFLTKSNGDINRLKIAAAFQLTYLGAPCIYYGTEIGMEGGNDPDCRRTMEWKEEKWNHQLYQYYKKLIYLRRKHGALRSGEFKWIKNLDKIIGYERKTEEETIIILINKHDQDKKVILDKKYENYTDLLADEKKSIGNDGFKLGILANEVKILKVLGN